MTTARIKTEFDGISQGLGWQLPETEFGPQWRHAGGEAGFESLPTTRPAPTASPLTHSAHCSDWMKAWISIEIAFNVPMLVGAVTLYLTRAPSKVLLVIIITLFVFILFAVWYVRLGLA